MNTRYFKCTKFIIFLLLFNNSVDTFADFMPPKIIGACFHKHDLENIPNCEEFYEVEDKVINSVMKTIYAYCENKGNSCPRSQESHICYQKGHTAQWYYLEDQGHRYNFDTIKERCLNSGDTVFYSYQ